MITIRISILLAFSLLANEAGDKKGGKKGKKGAKPKKAKNEKKKGDKSAKGGKGARKMGNEDVKVVVEKPKYLFEVGSPAGFSHIEYELIPGRPKYQVDVVCWGPIAKVFSADGEITLKTFVRDEIAWVPLSLKHVLNQLEVTELLKLHKHVINYTMWTSKNKLGARAKSENTKAFFIREEDIDSAAKFTEAYNTDPNLEKCEDKGIRATEEEIKNILWECADKPGMKNYEEIVTRLQFLSDPLHHHQVNKIIDSVIAGKAVECKEFVPTCPPPLTDEDLNKQIVTRAPRKKCKKDKKGKNGKKAADSKSLKSVGKLSKKSKASKSGKSKKGGKAEGVLKIEMPGEVFYTDPYLNIYGLKMPNVSVKHAFVLTTTKNLMRRFQKHLLNPLVIKIKKLSNLPVEILANNRFTAVYAYYSIPYVARCSTMQKPLEKVIKFNEAHAHFTYDTPRLKLVEFMQTQRLYVEIRGVRAEYTKPPKPHLFGTEKDDPNISSKLSPRQTTRKLQSSEEPSTVTLAVACFDISSLLKPAWDFMEKASSHHPDTLSFQKPNSMYENFEFTDTVTINELNLGALCKPKSWNPCTENILTDFGTTLKVEVYLSAPYNGLLEIQTTPGDYYQRILVVVKSKELAMTLLNGVMLHNQNILGPEIYVFNFAKGNLKQAAVNDGSKKDGQTSADFSAPSAAVTGFMLDNGNSYAFFLEGVASGFISTIWNQVMGSGLPTAKIFYNSDFCFERRLYADFLKFGGMYTICLKVSLDKIIGQEGIYLEGNVPLPGWEALKKINLLLKCATLRAMNQYCLFPTAKQLLSLDLEWGVPFKWKHGSFDMERSCSVKQNFLINQDFPMETQLYLTDPSVLEKLSQGQMFAK